MTDRSAATAAPPMRESARGLRRMVGLTGPVGNRLRLSVVLGAAAILSALGLLAVSGTLISRAALRPEVLTLLTLIVATRVLSISRAGFRYGERLASHDLALRSLASLRVRLYERLAPLVPGSLPGLRPGDALSRFVGDVETLQDLYLRAIAPPLVAGAVLLATGGFLLVVLPAAAPVLAAGLIVAGLALPAATVALSRRSGLREAPARGRLVDQLVEVSHGAAELVVAGREADAGARVRKADQALLAHQARDASAQGLAVTLGGIVQGLTLVGVLAIGVDATAAGRLDGILLAGVALLAFAAFEATLPLGDAARRLAACAGAADRIEEVLDAAPPVRDPATPVGLPATGTLVVADVTVVPPGSSTPVLENVSLAVGPGDRVAIVGPSGAGKTSLARALVRFVDPVQGTVFFGGVDLRRARQTDVRRAIRLVSQEAHLFTTSLRQNLALGRPDASEQQLITALERAGLGGWLATLPLGLDTMLGEEGTAVSGGQRRRIALARGLLSDSRYLVLDEPTAHLDAGGARELLHGLGTDRRDRRGILVIAHTYTGLEAFNEIVVLDGGRVVERGTHEQLLAADGPYAALVSGGTLA